MVCLSGGSKSESGGSKSESNILHHVFFATACTTYLRPALKLLSWFVSNKEPDLVGDGNAIWGCNLLW